MNRAKKILNFNISLETISEYGVELINDATIRKIRDCEKILDNVKGLGILCKVIETQNVGETYRLFMKVAPNGITSLRKYFNTKRKIRKLACCITYSENEGLKIIDTDYFELAIKLIQDNFTRLMIRPLFYTLIESWNHVHRDEIISLIKDKMKEIRITKAGFYQSLKDNFKYFEETDSGISSLCDDIIKSKTDLPHVNEFLLLPDSILSFDYFSEVVVVYTYYIVRLRVLSDNLNSILQFLAIHNNIDTNKRCLDKIINTAERLNFPEPERIEIINFCYNNIGDPGNDSYWNPWAQANSRDIQNLKNAQNILIRWLAKKFIYLFFDKIAMDNDRKRFWMNYLGYINNFKLYLNQEKRYSFVRNNSDIDQNLIKSKVGLLIDGGRSNAFILNIKDYLIVEFSKKGDAGYIYHASNNQKPKLSHHRTYLYKLKSHPIDKMAIKVNPGSSRFSTYYSEYNNYLTEKEGRFVHGGDWQHKLEYWIEEYLEI